MRTETVLPSKRDFLKLSASAAGTLLLPMDEPIAAAATNKPPHFFLLIVLDGGADPTYMFDARPLSMTRAGLVQNYLGEDPRPWEGRNGAATLATRLTRPLAAYRDRFSILNGVCMTPGFDGHLQNMNFLFSGNPFGGESFVPHLNGIEIGRAPDSLDAITLTEPPVANLSNTSSVVHLMPKSLGQLAERLRAADLADTNDPLQGFVKERIQASSSGEGRLAAGSRMMLTGMERARDLHQKLRTIKVPPRNLGLEQQSIGLVAECFRLALARSAIFVLREPFDVHAVDQAKRQPQLFESAIDRVAALLKGLIDTPFDDKRSMLDVTTFMVTSEFGRTLRARDMPIDQTGTHHNQFGNSILIGGKGIVGGQVIGGTDLAHEKEVVSGSHRSVDPFLEKAMGRPFDFATLKARPDLPEAFDFGDYLTIASVVNTLYTLFDVPRTRHRVLGRKDRKSVV